MADASEKVVIEIVEDDNTLLEVLVDKFTREGFKVIEAKNGKDGLDIALSEHPDLILLDILLPVMDGWTMLQKLRAENEWGKKVPVIVLTNLSSDDETQIANIVKLEPSYFLIKADWKIEDLVEKVRERLKDGGGEG